MKKVILITTFLLCCHTLVLSQDTNYLSKVNLESVEVNTTKKLNKLLLKYQFPKDYVSILKLNITDFEYKKEVVTHKYSENIAVKQRKMDSLSIDFENWRDSQVLTYEKAFKLWRKTASKHLLKEAYKEKYLNYHFYISFANPSETTKNSLKELASETVFNKIIKAIAVQETKRVISKCSGLKGMDSNAIKDAGDALFLLFKKKLDEKLHSLSVIELKRNSDLYCEFLTDKATITQKEIDAEKKQKEDELFVVNAVKTGVSAEKAMTILQLIAKRNKALEEYKLANNDANSMANLFENTDKKSKSEIKKEFAQELAKLINRKQFGKLFGEVFIKNVTTKTVEKMTSLKKKYQLSKKQEKAIKEVLETFYFNEEIVTAYYSFDKKIKKQKLSALRYRFEKEYKDLMDSYNLKVKPLKKSDQRTYQWR